MELTLRDRMMLEMGIPVYGARKDEDSRKQIFSVWDAEYGIQRERRDGGPGSGNFGHKGVPGQVGGSAPGNSSREVVHGNDISKTYTGDKSTKAVIEHQGFGGLPKIVGKKQFDAAVKASKFVAQRTYSASSQEILDAYRNQLWNGDFYVDCSVGGSQYGQGMYTAANYEGEITDGMREEMEHYQQLGTDRYTSEGFGRTLTKEDFESSYYCRNFDITDEEYDVFVKLKSNPGMTGYKLPDEEKKIWKDMLDNGKWQSMSMAHDDFLEEFEKEYKAPSYVETLTLTPDAKIITYDQIRSIQADSGTPSAVKHKRDYFTPTLNKLKSEGMKDDELLSLSYHLGLISEGDEDFDEKWDELAAIPKDRKIEIGRKIRPMLADLRKEWEEQVDKYRDLDLGAFAAMLGYDAINAKGHGASGSYTVVLNRTKTIFLDETMKEDSKDSKNSSTIFFQQGEDGVWYAIRGKEVIGWVKSFDAQHENRSDGGPGSGNFGHEGRPGKVGGSASEGKSGKGEKKHVKPRSLQDIAGSDVEKVLSAPKVGFQYVWLDTKDGKKAEWNGQYLIDRESGEIIADSIDAVKKAVSGARLSDGQKDVQDYLGHIATPGSSDAADPSDECNSYGTTIEARNETRTQMYQKYQTRAELQRDSLRKAYKKRFDAKGKLAKVEKDLDGLKHLEGITDQNVEEETEKARKELEDAHEKVKQSSLSDPNRQELVDRFFEAKEKYNMLSQYDIFKEEYGHLKENRDTFQKEVAAAEAEYHQAYGKMKQIIAGYDAEVDEMNKAVLKKYPAYSDIKTAQDADEYLTARAYFQYRYQGGDDIYSYYGVKGEPRDPSHRSVSLKGVEPEVARQTCETLDQIYEKYPEFAGYLGIFRAEKSKYLGTYDSGKVVIQEEGFSSQDEKGWNNGSWHPTIKGGPGKLVEHNSTVAHEVGHGLDEWLSKKCPDVALNMWYSSWKETSVSSKLLSQAARNLGITQTELKSRISGYAAKNTVEAFAEAFSEWICSDDPSPEVREIGRQIDSLYHTGKLAKKEKKK